MSSERHACSPVAAPIETESLQLLLIYKTAQCLCVQPAKAVTQPGRNRAEQTGEDEGNHNGFSRDIAEYLTFTRPPSIKLGGKHT